MKYIYTLITLAASSIFASAATDFGSGPALYARAFERVDHGSYNVYGSGLKDGTGFSREFQYSVAGVKNSSELMSPIQFTYILNFENYKSEVMENVNIHAEDGTLLFVSEMTWKPEETLSQDGKTLSYQLPGTAGGIYLRLADQQIPFDGESAWVEFENGNSQGLEVYDGYVIVPGWIYEQQGAFVVWKDGGRIATDIQTGLVVVGGKEVVETRSFGIEGLLPVEIGGRYPQHLYASEGYNPTYEAIVRQDGPLSIWIKNQYGEAPEGIWVTVVGAGKEPVYLQPAKAGFVSLQAQKGQTLHLKCRWSKRIKG